MNISIENFELKDVLIHCLIHNQLLTCQPVLMLQMFIRSS